MLPPVFIITLPHETGRQAQIAAQLERFGLSYEFFPASRKDALTAQDKSFYNSRRRRLALGKDLYEGEIACLHSHKRAIDMVVEKNLPYALILEDDCVMTEEFPQIIEALLARPALWQLVRFFGNEKHEKRPHRKLAKLFGHFWLVRIGTSPGESHCYLMSQSGARAMSRALAFTSTPIDILMGQPWKTGLGVLTVHPKVAWQDKVFESAIEEARFSGRLHVTGGEKLAFRLLNPLYNLRNNLFKRLWFYAALPKDRRAARQ